MPQKLQTMWYNSAKRHSLGDIRRGWMLKSFSSYFIKLTILLGVKFYLYIHFGK